VYCLLYSVSFVPGATLLGDPSLTLDVAGANCVRVSGSPMAPKKMVPETPEARRGAPENASACVTPAAARPRPEMEDASPWERVAKSLSFSHESMLSAPPQDVPAGLIDPFDEVDEDPKWADKYRSCLDRYDMVRTPTLGTDCAGIEAPCVAFKSVAIRYVHLSSSELKTEARNFQQAAKIMANHSFEEMADNTRGRGFCVVHGQYCELPEKREDIYVAGLPCQGWSGLGVTRWNRSVEEISKRKDFETYKEFALHLKLKKPRIAIFENVTAILKRKRDELETGWTRFLSMIKETCAADVEYYEPLIFTHNASIWLDTSRDRFYSVLVNKTEPPETRDLVEAFVRELERPPANRKKWDEYLMKADNPRLAKRLDEKEAHLGTFIGSGAPPPQRLVASGHHPCPLTDDFL
jgi:hypothetical protein